MKITIITPTYNSGKTLRDTLESLKNQNFKDFDSLVMDGGSSDDTIKIANEYKQYFQMTIVSEKDKGIFDAMNKGVGMATGDIVGILNSDDYYYDSGSLQKIHDCFADESIGACYGDLLYFDKDNTIKNTRLWRAGEYHKESQLASGWIPPHPTFFVRKSVYDKLEKVFDLDFPIAADYELMLRLIKVNKIKIKYIPSIITKMRTGGNCDRSLKRRNDGWLELRRSWVVNNLPVPTFYITRRVLNKVGQFLKVVK